MIQKIQTKLLIKMKINNIFKILNKKKNCIIQNSNFKKINKKFRCSRNKLDSLGNYINLVKMISKKMFKLNNRTNN